MVIERVISARKLKTSDRIDRLLLALESVDYGPGQTFRVSGTVDAEYLKWINLLCAWTEVEDPKGNIDIFQLLIDLQYIANPPNPRLTAKAFERLEQLTAGNRQFDQGFIAMWFGDEMTAIYNDGFGPAIADAGYKPMRIDRKEHNNKIDDEIIAEIRRSRFVVADMTCPIIHPSGGASVAVPRGGVYYEAGFAQGLGIPVIWCAQEGFIEHVHFDTRQYSHIVWSDAADLRSKLKVRIGAVIGYGAGAVT